MRTTGKTLVLIYTLLLFACMPALAQKIELAIGAGGYFPVSVTGVGNAAAIEGTFAYRVASVPLLSAYVEVPVVGTLNSSVRTFGLTSSASYSALFAAPGLKIKLAPAFPVSPWLAAGVGVAHYSGNSGFSLLGDNTANQLVVDFGGGLDVKVAPFLSLRGEVRDFYSGRPSFALAIFSQRPHNIVATAGVVVRF